MVVIQKTLTLSNEEYYITHLNIVNNFFPVKMSETEIKILSLFMSLEHSIIEEDMFNTLARKLVKAKLSNMSSSSLSNHLKSLHKKGFINKHEITNKLSIVDYLFPEELMQGYRFKLIKE